MTVVLIAAAAALVGAVLVGAVVVLGMQLAAERKHRQRCRGEVGHVVSTFLDAKHKSRLASCVLCLS